MLLSLSFTIIILSFNRLYLLGLIDCFNGLNVREKSEERNTFINLHYTERIGPIPE